MELISPTPTPTPPPDHSSHLTPTELSLKRPSPDSLDPESIPGLTKSAGKRPKNQPLNPHNDNVTEQWTQSTQFWAEDGNVILQVENTRFKVHQSRLAKESEWFGRLFGRASGVQHGRGEREVARKGEQGLDPEDIVADEYDGCLVFYIIPQRNNNSKWSITANDFEALLTALDDAISYAYHPPPFPTVASILCTSCIFHLPRMESYARTYIQSIFSDSLEDILRPNSAANAEAAKIYAAEAIVLGRTYNIPSILKRAFYELARREEVIQTPEPLRVRFLDRNDPLENNDEDDSNNPHIDPNAIRNLSSTDLLYLAHGQKKLATFWLRASSFGPLVCPAPSQDLDPSSSQAPSFSQGSSQDSSPPQPCTSAPHPLTRLQFLDLVADTGLLHTYHFDPILGLERLKDVGWEGVGYCTACAERRRGAFERNQEAVWGCVGRWFGVEVAVAV